MHEHLRRIIELDARRVSIVLELEQKMKLGDPQVGRREEFCRDHGYMPRELDALPNAELAHDAEVRVSETTTAFADVQ
ncbi:hypothetical protein [Agrobacterium cavarae]|uniref:hypothetical protein n=1 Tax=Agrobacterium cavarae TaxID=2528239 RepID=UPI0028AFA37F|nr:hypothetical protein [Agrobacterium cavarae]